MDREEYNRKMKEVIVKMVAESVMIYLNEVLMEKRADLIKNGVWPNNKEPRIYNFAPNTPRIYGRVKDNKEPRIIRPIVNKKMKLQHVILKNT